MSKKKAVRKSSHPAKKARKEKVAQAEKNPEYMVNIQDPKNLRKDVLESLREVIIFMQGYESFRQIQEEKVALFTKLKKEVSELQLLVNNKLRKYLPQGKLRAISREQYIKEEPPKVEKVEIVPKTAPPVEPVEKEMAPSDLEQLEGQLRDIERELQGLR
ncbi:hypothetical protein J4228_04805 [Candidatus Woesearchaeota archaeon]|nr:hypothetical protein [Candidatus Woesearchaeota archaeon]